MAALGTSSCSSSTRFDPNTAFECRHARRVALRREGPASDMSVEKTRTMRETRIPECLDLESQFDTLPYRRRPIPNCSKSSPTTSCPEKSRCAGIKLFRAGVSRHDMIEHKRRHTGRLRDLTDLFDRRMRAQQMLS